MTQGVATNFCAGDLRIYSVVDGEIAIAGTCRTIHGTPVNDLHIDINTIRIDTYPSDAYKAHFVPLEKLIEVYNNVQVLAGHPITYKDPK